MLSELKQGTTSRIKGLSNQLKQPRGDRVKLKPRVSGSKKDEKTRDTSVSLSYLQEDEDTQAQTATDENGISPLVPYYNPCLVVVPGQHNPDLSKLSTSTESMAEPSLSSSAVVNPSEVSESMEQSKEAIEEAASNEPTKAKEGRQDQTSELSSADVVHSRAVESEAVEKELTATAPEERVVVKKETITLAGCKSRGLENDFGNDFMGAEQGACSWRIDVVLRKMDLSLLDEYVFKELFIHNYQM